jgi:ELWxxDGT repeat protein
MDENGTLYFITRELGAPSGQTYEIHRSDGTPEGTYNLDGSPGSPYFNPSSMSLLRGTLYFDVSGSLYQSDGTVAGTEKLLGGVPEGGPRFASRVATFNDSLLITGSATFSDGELYISDGTPAGTRLLADINEGGDGTSSFPNEYVVGDSVAYFKTTASGFVRQLFAYDLTRQEVPAPAARIVETIVGNETSFGPGSIELVAEGRNLTYTLGEEMNTTGIFTGLEAGTYSFMVQDTFGCVATDSTEVQLALSNGGFSLSDEVVVYPNPSTIGGELQIQLPGSSKVHTLSLYSVSGQLLSSYQANVSVIRLPASAGTYVLLGESKSGQGLFRKVILVK